MKIKTLAPIYCRPKEWEGLEKRIKFLLKQRLYVPLMMSLGTRLLVANAIRDLRTAIEEGHVRYELSGFSGMFTAEVSKELKALGAVWSKRQFKWMIPEHILPTEIVEAITTAQQKDQAAKIRVTSELTVLSQYDITQEFNPAGLFEDILGGVDHDFRRSVKSVILAPKMSKRARKQIAVEYSENMKLYIRKWTKQRIIQLRKEVNEMTFKGERYSELAKKIQQDYEVSARKARFLARQETNLLTAKIKQLRYADVGIDKYLWVSVTGTEEHPVRPLHKKLTAESKAGKVFSFSNPPVSGTKGEHQNPGEPFGCRCVARPVITFANLPK